MLVQTTSSHRGALVTRKLTLLLPKPRRIHLARLLILADKPILPRLLVDLGIGQERHLLARTDIAHVLTIPLGKDEVDFLQASLARLGVEEIDDGEEGRVDDSEDEIRRPADVAQHDGRDHDDEEVEEPVRARGDGVGLGARLDRVDFGRVQPRERQPGRAEERDVGEEADGCAFGVVRTTWDQACEDEDHGQALADGPDEEELAASGAFDDEPRDGGEDGIDDHVDTAEEERHGVAFADGVLEENGEVVDDCVAAPDLLEELGGCAEHHAAEMLGFTTSQERPERGVTTVMT